MGAVNSIRAFLRFLGPGVITGASDNDPAGISTYSVTGASTGYDLLWLSVFTLPLIIAVQVMSAKIGLVTRKGLARVIKENCGLPVVAISVIVLLVSNIVTIGADLAGMASAINLLVPRLRIAVLVIVIAFFTAVIEIFVSYKLFERYLKWVLLVLVTYILAGFYAHPDWSQALRHTFIPTLNFDKAHLTALVAVFGTTVSPYLFFWQTSQEIEELKAEKRQRFSQKMLRERLIEVDFGFLFANIVFYFIILTTAATLHQAGIANIETAAQAAEALKPIAGSASTLLFAIGIIASGLLAIPVLAGSTAYVVAELFDWPEGLSLRARRAPGFYGILVLSVLIGTGIDFVNISPIQALYYSQVIVGIITPALLIVITLIANNKKILGNHVNGLLTNSIAIITVIAMTAAAILFFVL
ncbi:MAG: Nramp family divalent metal transporter [Candidatus Aquicultor sp.]